MAHELGNSSSLFKNKLRVLVVDDVKLHRMVIVAILRKLGVEFQEAENGKEAVDLLAASPANFDLIFMDKDMPMMDGAEATKKIRAMGLTTKIVGVTSRSPSEAKDFIDAGLDEFITKPMGFDRLMELLREVDGGS